MVTIFNRKELFTTMDPQVYGRICQQLQDAGVDFDVVSKSIYTGDIPGSGAPVRGPQFDYIIYVRKKDFDLAQAAMARRN